MLNACSMFYITLGERFGVGEHIVFGCTKQMKTKPLIKVRALVVLCLCVMNNDIISRKKQTNDKPNAANFGYFVAEFTEELCAA